MSIDYNPSNVAPVNVDPVKRFSVNSLTTDDSLNFNIGSSDNSREEKLRMFKRAFENGGYVRVYIEEQPNPDYESDPVITDPLKIAEYRKYSAYYFLTNSGNVSNWGWSYPVEGWFRIYSGQRFCSNIENENCDGNHNVPLHWFVITDVDEEYDGNTRFKTVSAYSFEYTISNRTISLSEDNEWYI